jgi:hypothetical protein
VVATAHEYATYPTAPYGRESKLRRIAESTEGFIIDENLFLY